MDKNDLFGNGFEFVSNAVQVQRSVIQLYHKNKSLMNELWTKKECVNLTPTSLFPKVYNWKQTDLEISKLKYQNV